VANHEGEADYERDDTGEQHERRASHPCVDSGIPSFLKQPDFGTFWPVE
jgi:hypothetical protein